MVLEQEEYNKLVIAAYKKKRAEKRLSLLLANSTRAQIRTACIHRYQERTSERDDRMLSDFFGPAQHGKQFLTVIEHTDAEKFRSLNNFLTGKSESTNNLNIELLAWLIDFRHRPFSSDIHLELDMEELAIIDGEEFQQGLSPSADAIRTENEVEINPSTETWAQQIPDNLEGSRIFNPLHETSTLTTQPYNAGEDKQKIISENDLKKGKWRKIWERIGIVFLTAGVCSVGVYALISTNSKTDCVSWSDDHYEKVPCDEPSNDRIIFHLPEKKWKNFKRITRPDTITERSIGKLYYIKDNGPKFYTQSGFYPEDPGRSVRILTRRIFDTYLAKKTDTCTPANELKK